MFLAVRSGSYVESGSRGVHDQSVEESIRELTSIGALLSRVHGEPPRELHPVRERSISTSVLTDRPPYHISLRSGVLPRKLPSSKGHVASIPVGSVEG
jgi:hypothetical protein